MKIVILFLISAIVMNTMAADIGACSIQNDYYNGYAVENIGEVIDYSRGTAKSTTGTVTDYKKAEYATDRCYFLYTTFEAGFTLESNINLVDMPKNGDFQNITSKFWAKFDNNCVMTVKETQGNTQKTIGVEAGGSIYTTRQITYIYRNTTERVTNSRFYLNIANISHITDKPNKYINYIAYYNRNSLQYKLYYQSPGNARVQKTVYEKVYGNDDNYINSAAFRFSGITNDGNVAYGRYIEKGALNDGVDRSGDNIMDPIFTTLNGLKQYNLSGSWTGNNDSRAYHPRRVYVGGKTRYIWYERWIEYNIAIKGGDLRKKSCTDGYQLVQKDNIDVCAKEIKYLSYAYSCPSGKPKDTGVSSFTKTDIDETKDNSASLSTPANSPTPPNGNCKSVVKYKYYAYDCKNQQNTQGYNWHPIDKGYSLLTRKDTDYEADDSETLSLAENPPFPPANNCYRSYQECKFLCPTGMTFNKDEMKCIEDYTHDCERKGLVYDANQSKCVVPISCADDEFLNETNQYCSTITTCKVFNGTCTEEVQGGCNDGFTYNTFTKSCEKPNQCSDAQVVDTQSEYCQSIPTCDPGDIETFSQCIKYTQVGPIDCGDSFRINNICYKNNQGGDILEERKQVVTHDINGEGLSPEVFNSYTTVSCEEGSCSNALNKIKGRQGILCFEKGNGNANCIEAPGCEFVGSIQSDKYLTSVWANGNLLSAQDVDGNLFENAIESTCTMMGLVGYKGRKYPILGTKPEADDIKFWSSYGEEGYLGKIKILPSISQEDIDAGYYFEKQELWDMLSDGFGLIETIGNETYAVSREAMSQTKCTQMAEKYGFSEYNKIYEIPSDRSSYDLVTNTTGGSFGTNDFVRYYKILATICPANTTYDYETRLCGLDLNSTIPDCPEGAIDKINGICYMSVPEATEHKCVLKRGGNTIDFSDVSWAIRQTNIPQKSYMCSELTCAGDNTCQTASCQNGYSGNIISSEKTQPTENECTGDICDANLPYYELCGKDGGCPLDMQGVREQNGRCYKVVCAEGGYDEASGKCFKWQCPSGYTQNGDRCEKSN